MPLLNEMTIQDFKQTPCWKVLETGFDENDVKLVEAAISDDGTVLATNGEVWCKGIATFNNGLIYDGVCMCRADASDGPLLITIWNGQKDVSIIMPPAPDFVLENEGPEPFCQAFHLSYQEIFPIQFLVEAKFEVAPLTRQRTIE